MPIPIEKTANIVVLTGAGLSADSGLETFRDPQGVWSRVNIEDVATPQAFEKQPHIVHDFYNWRRRQLLSKDIQPNSAHEALARLERDWQGDVLVVTQNVDDLHERAGQKNLVHMHGELLKKKRCVACGTVSECREELGTETACKSCGQKAGLRPHIVWFGEIPMGDDVIFPALTDADLFISIGTSGHVYPAAGFVHLAAQAGAVTAECNLEPSQNAQDFEHGFYGRASVIVPDFVEGLFASA